MTHELLHSWGMGLKQLATGTVGVENVETIIFILRDTHIAYENKKD